MAQKNYRPFCLEVWGDYACFTRPEMKVERVSYDVPTPSAVRAVFEAIFWKPAIRWRVKKIEILNPIKWISLRRNELGSIISHRGNNLFIEDCRQQRAGLFLRDVRYRFYAVLEYLSPEQRPPSSASHVDEHPEDNEEIKFTKELFINDSSEPFRSGETPGKYLAIFERRARNGQCFNQPYLGCREFSCNFRLIDYPDMEPLPINETRDLGWMLYDMEFSDPLDPQPMFFHAMLENGVVLVPPPDSEEVRR